MPFVITEACVDVMDKSCIDECPVDCIYEGARKLYINPFECIDCSACEPACPVDAISPENHVEAASAPHVEDNASFFTDVLEGRDKPLGEQPGGASAVGVLGIDTPLVSHLPPALG